MEQIARRGRACGGVADGLTSVLRWWHDENNNANRLAATFVYRQSDCGQSEPVDLVLLTAPGI
jgi:hypothetical protein